MDRDPGRPAFLEEVTPQVSRMTPLAEHAFPHQFLAMSFANTIDAPPFFIRSDNLALLFVLNEMAAKNIRDISVSVPITAEMFKHVYAPIFEVEGFPYYDGRKSGQITSPLFSAPGQTYLYLRDQIMQGIDEQGKHMLAGALLPNQDPRANASLLYPFGKRSGAKTVILGASFEGGNIVPTKNHIFTMKGTVLRNLLMLELLGTRVSPGAVEDYLAETFAKETVVLDADSGYDKGQVLYHLDLLMSPLSSPTGEEYILVSSLAAALKLLESNGIYKNGKVNEKAFARWIRTTTPGHLKAEAQQEAFNSHVERVRRSLKMHGKPLQFVRGLLKDAYQSQALAPENLAKHASIFFNQNNLTQILQLTEMVIEKLLALGYPADHIKEVPGLLFSQNTKIEKDPHAGPILTDYPAPIYTPANGVQYNHPGQKSQYITVGGISPFDKIVREVITREIGIDCIQLESLLPFGQGLSGLRCLAVPVAQV